MTTDTDIDEAFKKMVEQAREMYGEHTITDLIDWFNQPQPPEAEEWGGNDDRHD